MSETETMISRIRAQNDRLESQVTRMTQESQRNTEDTRWIMADLVQAKLQLAKAQEEITSLRAEIKQLRSGQLPPDNAKREIEKESITTTSITVTEVLPVEPGPKKEHRTRIGIYTPAELTALGEDALDTLDEQVAAASVKELSADQFEYIFREAGMARLRPHHYEISGEEASRRFNDISLSVNERNYWQMVRCANKLVEMSWDNAWWVDRMLFRITMMEYLDWRGIKAQRGAGVEWGTEVEWRAKPLEIGMEGDIEGLDIDEVDL